MIKTYLALKIPSIEKIIPINQPKSWIVAGEAIIVQTNRGIEYGKVVSFEADEKNPKNRRTDITINKMLRRANEIDIKYFNEAKILEKEILEKAHKLIKLNNYRLKIFNFELIYDRQSIYIYYKNLNDDKKGKRNRIQELISNLEKDIKCRIIAKELLERGLTKLMGGLGICGCTLCCQTFLDKLPNISVKMAKEQNLSMNMPKLSGICGKLKCCLRYESGNYINGCLESCVNKDEG